MSDFILKPSLYDHLPEFLQTSVLGFLDSPEFRTISEFRDLPGVVCGALGQYLARLQREAESLDSEGKRRLASIYKAIEAMSASEDPEVQNAVQVEIFEILNDDSNLWEKIRSSLLPASRALSDWRLA